MILYGMGDPVEALRLLMPYVMQVHLKDATPAATPGQWGAEVPVGTGAVDWKAFFRVLNDAAWKGNLCIEREAGEQRIEDIRSGLAFVAPFIR
jgi:sugar phosphate isomerase/epimerase